MRIEPLENPTRSGLVLGMKAVFAVVFGAVCLPTSVNGKESEKKETGVFHIPAPASYLMHVTAGPESDDPFADPFPPASHFQVVKNPIGRVLPGTLHDARSFFEKFGVTFSNSDIAWHHPASGLLVVEAKRDAVNLVEAVLDTMRWPSERNLILSGRFIETASIEDAPKEKVLDGWRMPCQSGVEIKVSKNGAETMQYDINLTNSLGSDGMTFQFLLEMTATLRGNQFKLETSACGTLDKPVEILLQQSPEDGKNIHFELSVTEEIVSPVPPSPKKEEMQKLREEITKMLRARS